jgi:hypothetical protein
MADHRIQTMAIEDAPAFTGMPWPVAEGGALKVENLSRLSSRQRGEEGGEEQGERGEERGMYSLGEPQALAYIIGERRPSGPEGDRGSFGGFDKKGHEVRKNRDDEIAPHPLASRNTTVYESLHNSVCFVAQNHCNFQGIELCSEQQLLNTMAVCL